MADNSYVDTTWRSSFYLKGEFLTGEENWGGGTELKRVSSLFLIEDVLIKKSRSLILDWYCKLSCFNEEISTKHSFAYVIIFSSSCFRA